ncbi:ABC transporter ATP-binding protein [Desulfuribacillus stibiiarsenatis]|uniref:ABC transporter ATP-binding protein n=1 Tax=Desulfuribacillus stibiiarsenatis TaxID=1390249 RepID=A0A1E5L7G8_9FIRM|nr:ABC transporter ATP-binding protein [Desulfuribacillus stibiiarsenatis]OEH86097.1 ABC transporter ATP-binding protein [Desulfuribacillus stibiiarsenatis]
MSFIQLKDVTKVYDSKGVSFTALQKVDLTIERGEFVSLMGPSGSGKSTLLTILGTLNPPSTGKLMIDDIDIYQLSQERRADFRYSYTGFVFQQMHLLPYLSAIENVMLPLSVSKYSGKEQLTMAEQVLDKVGLLNKKHRLPNEMSGGEQQRVAIARAIVNNPPIVFADEPTGSLDTKTGEEILELFKSLNKQGHTIIMVTHNPETVEYVSRVVVIRDGLIESDTYRSKGE